MMRFSAPRAPRHLRELWALNRDAIRAHRERRRALSQPPALWADLPRRVFEEHEPVFVLSTGRCGTRLLTDVFELADGVICHHAPQPELWYAERLAYERGLEEFEAFATAIRACRFELVADCVIRGRRYIETNQRITFFAPHLNAVFPRARFIHLVRHPAAFVRSGVIRRFYTGQRTDVGRIVPVRGDALERWPAMSSVERCAWLWSETNRFIEDFKPRCDPARVLTVKAEDLFAGPAAAASVFAFCGLPAPAEPRLRRRLLRPVNASAPDNGLPAYAEWPAERQQELRRWAPDAARYGYAL